MKIRILLQKGFQPIVFRLPASQPKKYTWMSIFFIHVQASQRIYITNTVGHSIKYLYITWKTWLKSQVLKRNIYLFVYSNNKSKLVSVTKGKGRDGKKRRISKSHINIIVLIVRNYVHIWWKNFNRINVIFWLDPLIHNLHLCIIN